MYWRLKPDACLEELPFPTITTHTYPSLYINIHAANTLVMYTTSVHSVNVSQINIISPNVQCKFHFLKIFTVVPEA